MRLARPEDVPALVALSRSVYGRRGAWLTRELHLHQARFPEGQLVAVDGEGRRILGMAVSLVVGADDWPLDASWHAITGYGRLGTHDPRRGDSLYGAGVAVDPRARGRGVARSLYAAREALLERLDLARIRAGARISGFHRVANVMTPEHYVREVVAGRRHDPTLSFHLHMGFRVLGVARDYLPLDRRSRGHAAVVEWMPAKGG